MDVNASTAPGVEQDSVFDTTSLPADHPPKLLAEAKRTFQDSRPPFVTSSNRDTEGSKRLVFITNNGQRPALPIRTNLVARDWDRKLRYWTLDLNGERFIVQAFPNNGSVSGAKYVYCSWTGVGKDFEDLPLAFSCIRGKYPSDLGPRMESRAVAHESTANKDTSISATASSLGQSHSPNVERLLEDHAVEHLDEAKELYANSRPPFVIRKTKKPRRDVLLAVQDGQCSATSTEAEVVYRTWNSVEEYPTLDLNGKRFIVMGNAGGRPGHYQYHLWLGSKIGRVKEVVAYSCQHVNANKTALGLTENMPKVDEESSLSPLSTDEEDQDSPISATGDQQYHYNNFKKAFDPTAIPTSTPRKFEIGRSIIPSESSAQKERPRREKRARSPSSPVHFDSRKDKAPAHASKRTSRRARHTTDDTSVLSPQPYETRAPTPSINGVPAPDPNSIPQNPQVQPPACVPNIALYKQTHTTLRVTRDSTIIGFVPLRLLTCMTMSALFSGVIAASGYREEGEPIKCLMAVFDWKDDTDIYKTIYIDKGTEGSFEIFLEIIDEASCWKDEGGKCGVAVEIVRA